VCKKLAALPSCFTVLSLRLFYKFLMVHMPVLKDRIEIKLPTQSLNFCSLFVYQKRLKTSTKVVEGKTIKLPLKRQLLL